MKITLNEDEVDLILLALQSVITDAEDEAADLAHRLEQRIVGLIPAPSTKITAGPVSTAAADWPSLLKQAIQGEIMVEIAYTDRQGKATRRRVCPIFLDHPKQPERIETWCERRKDFRQFRLDRIRSMHLTGEPYPRRHRLLKAEWLSVADDDDRF